MLFLAVADAGGLSGASRATGASLPTLSRRMTEIERRSGRTLFRRGPRGYSLTSEGRTLLDRAEPLRAAAQSIAAWATETAPVPRVRITAGFWTSRHIAQNVDRVYHAADGWLPEFLASNADIDIARRAADIGIRNRRPEQPWLAGRRTVHLDYAVYAATPEVRGFVALSPDSPTTPSDRWLRATHAGEIVTTASDARLALDLALAGVGRIVMPCFAGNAEPGLVQIGPAIAGIGHDEWIVSHHEGRHDPPVRRALEAIHRLLTDPGRQASNSASQ